MLVPGPGLEPGWVAPTVFETVASTDSAIRAMERMHAHTFRACKGNKFFPFSQYCVAFCAKFVVLCQVLRCPYALLRAVRVRKRSYLSGLVYQREYIR